MGCYFFDTLVKVVVISRSGARNKTARSCDTADAAGILRARSSGKRSRHWERRTILPALFPAWAIAHFIICHGALVSTKASLQNAPLAKDLPSTAHHAQTDIRRIAPLTLLPLGLQGATTHPSYNQGCTGPLYSADGCGEGRNACPCE